MKASRRKFFGLMGGAAVAGPAAAKSVVEPLVSAGGPPVASGYYGVAIKADTTQSKASRIAELVKRLSGFRSNEEIEQERSDRLDNAANMFRYEVDALRSVSARHKLSMIRAKYDAVAATRRRYWWESELKGLRGEN